MISSHSYVLNPSANPVFSFFRIYLIYVHFLPSPLLLPWCRSCPFITYLGGVGSLLAGLPVQPILHTLYSKWHKFLPGPHFGPGSLLVSISFSLCSLAPLICAVLSIHYPPSYSEVLRWLFAQLDCLLLSFHGWLLQTLEISIPSFSSFLWEVWPTTWPKLAISSHKSFLITSLWLCPLWHFHNS